MPAKPSFDPALIARGSAAEAATFARGPAAREQASRIPESWHRFRFPQSLYRYVALLTVLAFIAYAVDRLNIVAIGGQAGGGQSYSACLPPR